MALLNQASLYISDRTLSAENTLREGSLVYVRILENLGDGNYEATFAGKRFPVFSRNDLTPGTGFRARISISGSSVVLEPADSADGKQSAASDSTDVNRSSYKTGISFSNFNSILSENPQILDRFFSALSLPSDLLSLKIAQFLAQSGLKLDSAVAGKIHRIALKFGEKGAEAAEKALLLYEKNGHVDEDEVEKLLALCSGESLEADTGEDLNQVLAKANRKSKGNGYWLVVPYEMQIPKDENNQKKLIGSLCLFKDDEDRVKKLTVRGKYEVLDFVVKADFHYDSGTLKKNLLNSGKNKGKIGKVVLRYLVQKNGIDCTYRDSDSALMAALKKTQNPDAEFDIALMHDEKLAAETLLTDDVPVGTVRILQ